VKADAGVWIMSILVGFLTDITGVRSLGERHNRARQGIATQLADGRSPWHDPAKVT